MTYHVRIQVCEEGETKCIGSDLYQCQNGEWVLIEPSSPKCVVPPPIPVELILAGIGIIAIGGVAYYLTR